MSHLVTRLVSAACLVAALGACAAEEEDLGTVDVNLVGQAPSGTVYVLRHAEITVTGASGTMVFRTDDDVERTRLSADVVTGSYTAAVSPGWQLLRRNGTVETPVVATLTSPNPAQFNVTANASTSVELRFSVSGETVPLEHGSFDITIGIDEPTLSTVGYSQPLPTTHTWSSGYVFAESIDIAAPTRLRRFGYIGGDVGPSCRFGVYNDSGDAPNTLLAAYGPTVVQSDRVELDGPSTVLPAGRYWLAGFCDSNVTLRGTDTFTHTLRYIPWPIGSTLPDVFGSSFAHVSAALNMYLVVEVL